MAVTRLIFKKDMFMKTLLMLSSLVLCMISFAEVTFDASKNTIYIEGFPPDMPCSMKTVYMTNKINGWGKVKFDKKTATYTVDANINIGGNTGVDGCLKLGSSKLPNETLIVNGILTVSPFYIQSLNPEKSWKQTKKNINALIIGDPENPQIKPILKFGKNGNLQIGYLPEYRGKVQFGGELRVYNGTITAANDRFGGNVIWFSSYSKVILKNAAISGFKGRLRSISRFAKVYGTTFSDANILAVRKAEFRNCTFSNMTCAIFDYGGLNAVFTNCVFKDNIRNFSLRYGKGVTCIDCEVGKTKANDNYQMRIFKGQKIFPAFFSKRHVIIKVVDVDGKPIPEAKVSIKCEQQVEGIIENSETVTGENGCTPVKGNKKAVLLTDEIKIATEKTNIPRQNKFTYTISVKANKLSAVIKNFIPAKSWQEVVIKVK